MPWSRLVGREAGVRALLNDHKTENKREAQLALAVLAIGEPMGTPNCDLA